jgi:hypothetical protein
VPYVGRAPAFNVQVSDAKVFIPFPAKELCLGQVVVAAERFFGALVSEGLDSLTARLDDPERRLIHEGSVAASSLVHDLSGIVKRPDQSGCLQVGDSTSMFSYKAPDSADKPAEMELLWRKGAADIPTIAELLEDCALAQIDQPTFEKALLIAQTAFSSGQERGGPHPLAFWRR